MLADSIKVKGFSCFKDNWAGFDEFKPITVIIGRNNSGKSHLLKLVEMLTLRPKELSDYAFKCRTTLREDCLREVFSQGTSGGRLRGDHWERHGLELVGEIIAWECNNVSKEIEFQEHPCIDVNRERYLRKNNGAASPLSPFYAKEFKHLLADRDIQSESANDGSLELEPNGGGATNLIRRYLNSSQLEEGLVEEQLLKALDRIFGVDGQFKRIQIQQHEDQEDKRWEIYLTEEGKGAYQLSEAGSGLKTIILVLLNLLVLPELKVKEAVRPKNEYVFAFEELENNLHPALLRRLFDYLTEYVKEHKCHLFLTTHSNVALDYFSTDTDAQILQVTHDGTSANVRTINGHFDRVDVLNDLGAKPSDLLQANGIIWLEGRSDRIYLNRFIELYSDGELREGRDYQYAFYGGSVLANVEFKADESSEEIEQATQQLANLLRLNNNIAIVCDSDKTSEEDELKGRVLRIQTELQEIHDAYLWITEPKEIENYIPGEVWAESCKKSNVPDPGQFDSFPSSPKNDDFVRKNLGHKSFGKCDFAAKAVKHFTKENLEPRFDLKEKMQSLVATIRKWNA